MVTRVGDALVDRGCMTGLEALSKTRGIRVRGLGCTRFTPGEAPFPAELCPLVRAAGNSPELGPPGSGEVGRIGEYSVKGKTGWILEVKPAGEPGLRAVSGGGVADIALGEEWFEGSGERAGEDGCGENCSAGGLGAGRGDGRCMRMLCAVDEDSSTSCNSDCKKLGAPCSTVNCRLGIGLAGRDDCWGAGLVALDALLSDAQRMGTLGRLRRLITIAADSF